MNTHDVAIIGSGPGGTILARALRSRGLSVVLIERGEHPRFAIGESSTPLSNLSLERLAHEYGLVDLWHLAQHGRWLQHAPEVGRGLKRGFTFYRHHPGEELRIDAENTARLLVAASPDDEIADTHWVRAEVDHFLVDRGVHEGVDYRPGCRVCDVKEDADSVTLHCEVIADDDRSSPHSIQRGDETGDSRSGSGIRFSARFVVDASGSASVLAQALGIPDRGGEMRTQSGVVGTHFQGLPTFVEFLTARGRPPCIGPYPDDWAAVHHWIDEGWIYSLRFDDGRVSAGLVLEGRGEGGPDAHQLWGRTLARYPDLQAYFAMGTPCEPWIATPVLQRRAERATGHRWAMLPFAFAFVDPMFSAGLAWTLRGVERLADSILRAAAGGDPAPDRDELTRYDELLQSEAIQMDHLIAGAYAARCDFRLTAAHSMLYFAAVSWSETMQRLKSSSDDAWTPLLGGDDILLSSLPQDALELLAGLGTMPEIDDASVGRFTRWVTDAIEGRNVAGLCDPTKFNLYGVDTQDLVRSADLLDMTGDEVREKLPILRGRPRP